MPAKASKPHASNLARRLDLASMQIFIAITETGSISKAAARESIAVSAASKRLSDMEAAFGTALLYRHSKGITLTPAGQSFLQHARIILRSVDEMESSLSEFAQGMRGHVRMHATLAAITQFLPADLAVFAQDHADIAVDLEERLTADVIRSVEDGEADLGISTLDENPAGLESRPYRLDHLMAVLPPHHALAALPATSFDAVLDYELVELHQHSATSTAMHRAAARMNRQVRTRVRVTGPDVMCHMIRVGLGIGILPKRALDAVEHAGNLVAVRLTDDWALRRIVVLARSFARLPVPARLLADHLGRSGSNPGPLLKERT